MFDHTTARSANSLNGPRADTRVRKTRQRLNRFTYEGIVSIIDVCE